MVYSQSTIDKIKSDINIVDYASKYLDLEERDGEFWAICPFHKGDVNPSLSLNADKNMFWCFGCHSTGDIIEFVRLYHNLSFYDAIEYLLNQYQINPIDKENSDTLKYLKSTVRKERSPSFERNILSKNIMNKYTKQPIVEWINEGMLPSVLEKYDVRYDFKNNKIVFPIKDRDGNIISIKGRTLFADYEQRIDFDGKPMKKYRYYTEIGHNDFLFGLYGKEDCIKKRGEIVIAEGAKSVLLADSYGCDNCVSLETNRINDYQIDLILQLKCDVVIALDKGMKITTQKMKNTDRYTYINIGILPKLTNVYVVEDKYNVLPEKASPFDCGKEVWEKLYEERIKIN